MPLLPLQRINNKNSLQMETISFDQLPTAVSLLTKEVVELKQLILQSREQEPQEPCELLFTIQEAADFMRLSVPTMYSKVSKGELPSMKRGKRLYFSRSELMSYIKQGRRSSNDELEAKAEAYFNEKKNK
jgi:excisionase family DNA binding protein